MMVSTGNRIWGMFVRRPVTSQCDVLSKHTSWQGTGAAQLQWGHDEGVVEDGVRLTNHA